jgi:hypothetical protein
MNTYFVNHDNVDGVTGSEIILTNPNVPYIEQGAHLAIMNNYGSDSVVYVKDIQINERIGLSTTALTNLNVQFISAHTGEVTITPNKYDSNYANLPSQVVIYRNPNSVSTTGAILRRDLSIGGLNAATALLGMFGTNGSGISNTSFNHSYQCFDSGNQPYTLREGQGLAIMTSLISPMNYPLEVVINFHDGTNYYSVNEVINVQCATELFSMLNGSGSGVVLYVTRIQMRLIKQADIMRMFTIRTCVNACCGDLITPLSADSSNTALDSLVNVRGNCIVTLASADAKIGVNKNAGGSMPVRRIIKPSFGKGVDLANGILQVLALQNRDFVGEIVLREGEGLCVIQDQSASSFGQYSINVIFTVLDNGTAVAGGASSYIF